MDLDNQGFFQIMIMDIEGNVSSAAPTEGRSIVTANSKTTDIQEIQSVNIKRS